MSIELIIDQRKTDLGGGFEVGRVLPYRQRRMVGPFIFFDHMGPMNFTKGFDKSLDIRPHPHIGLATVTYLFEGSLTHRDSTGIVQEIKPAEINWMVAGSGITHSERLEYMRADGGVMHGLQTWVALPQELEEQDPEFHHYAGNISLPLWNDAGKKYRLLAGNYAGMRSDVKTQSPLFYLHLNISAGSTENVPNEYSERAVYVVNGAVELNQQPLTSGQMAILGKNNDIKLQANTDSTIVIIGGEPLGERYLDWNFVSSSKDRLKQARDAWMNGEMKLPDGETETIAYPEYLLKRKY